MVTLNHIDTVQNRVVFNLNPGTETIATVQELGSLIKQELKLAPLADDSDIFTWSGLEALAGGNVVGIVMVLRPGWTLWTTDAGAKHRFRITEGIVLGDSGTDPLGTPTNIIWSLAEYTVSSTLGQTATDIATLVTTLADMDTRLLKVQRYLGIGVKREIDGLKIKISEEDKITPSQQYTIDSATNPTVQTDDDI